MLRILLLDLPEEYKNVVSLTSTKCSNTKFKLYIFVPNLGTNEFTIEIYMIIAIILLHVEC